MVRIVTITGEFGSGTSEIASKLASELNWKLLDRNVLDDIARAAKIDRSVAERCDERVDSFFHRALKGFWHGSSPVTPTAVADPVSVFDAESMAEGWGKIIKEAGSIGDCVIVGRGSQCILQDRKDVFHVFMYGPWGQKLRRVRKLFPAEKDPEGLIARTDHNRALYIRKLFNQDFYDRHLYHAMLSSCMGEAAVADSLAGLVRAPDSGGRPV
jgi:cytidylate kinase